MKIWLLKSLNLIFIRIQVLLILLFLFLSALKTEQSKELKFSDINVKLFGAKGDGVTDDFKAIQAALDKGVPYGSIYFPHGTYIISKPLNIHINNLIIKGPAKLVAKSGESFEYVLLGVGVQGVIVEDLDIDANQQGRSSRQDVRFMGAGFMKSTNCKFLRCTARNTRGYNGISAVGLAMAGQSIAGTLDNCSVIDCGNPGFDSDGIFTSGTRNTISNCTAKNCTDAAFVIESSNYSLISNCKSINCSAGAGITNATVDDKYGNTIKGLTIVDWCGSNTGGIQIGMPGNFAGNLYHSQISNVSLFADKSRGYGYGPAILIRHDGPGRPINILIDSVLIDGSYNQGIVVNGDEVAITNSTIKNVVDACVQYQNDSQKGIVYRCSLTHGSFGVASQGTAKVLVKESIMRKQTSYGLYAFNKSSIASLQNSIESYFHGRSGKDVGALILMTK